MRVLDLAAGWGRTSLELVSLATARETAAPYRDATFWELPGHGHMLVLEPGAATIAQRIAEWIPD